MRPIETLARNLPVATEASSGFSSYRGAPRAAFISQLIAERYRMAPQRTKRLLPTDIVLRTYDAAGRIAVRRMPPGYRMDVDA